MKNRTIEEWDGPSDRVALATSPAGGYEVWEENWRSTPHQGDNTADFGNVYEYERLDEARAAYRRIVRALGGDA